MRRHLLIAAIFLLAGAVVNVAVAWVCAVRINVFESTRHGGSTRELAVNRFSAFGSTWLWILRGGPQLLRRFPENGPAPEEVTPYWAAHMHSELALEPPLNGIPHSRPITLCRVTDARGWPLRTMYCDQVHQVVRDEEFSQGLMYPPGSLRVPRRWEDLPVRHGLKTSMTAWSAAPWAQSYTFPRVLPYRPIWPGVTVNTIFYAMILWVVSPAPFALRRSLRLRRGLCPKCAYPIGESSVCSECGKDLSKRLRPAT